MDIEIILPLITHICIYYYKAYYNKIYNRFINIDDKIINDIMNKLYIEYTNKCMSTYVSDIMIMYCNYQYEKQYTLNNGYPNINDIENHIDNFINNNNFYNNRIPINVINVSNTPFDIGLTITSEWIKHTIDLYMY